MSARLQSFITAHGITRTEIGVALSVSESGVSRRMSGAIRWTVDEANTLLALASERAGRPVLFEELFAPEDAHAADAPATDQVTR